ncbi:MAG TPA: beta-ketoacyl-[acyl-carrier-protein] synthase family protein [Pseudonocardiaceae bacterium]|nr:beta-ketoacyl-[acyl-carrier-protein] synthase family protein [Pseudonocardiaceae bacterium]
MSTVRVTGMAWCTALGDSLDGVWHQLLDGATGIRDVPSGLRLRSTLAAAVDGLPEPLTERQVALAGATVRAALADAGLPPAAALLVAGTSHGAHLDDEHAGSLDLWATDTAARLGMTAPPVSISTACSSGSDAIMVGAQLIRAGAADVCVCGGADVLTDVKRLGHSALGTMSTTSLRTFHPDGDGTLLGEGAAFLVLESEESAARRGVAGHAVFVGAGSSNDASGMTAPDPSGDGLLLAVRRCLADGDADLAEVTVVNAHGSGTPTNDTVEAHAYSRLFADGPRPAVFATKGAFGHTLGATGAIEAVATVLALRDRVVPPVFGLTDQPPSLPLPVPFGGPMPVKSGVGLSLTLGFGGFNTCLAFEAAHPDA